jgi:hypothetical protein
MNSARDNIMANIKKGLENRSAHKLEKPDFVSPIYVESDEHLTVVKRCYESSYTIRNGTSKKVSHFSKKRFT